MIEVVGDTPEEVEADEVSGNFFTGLPVARSTDGGNTWQVTYADQVPGDTVGCSFSQYIGSTPAVASDGTLYVVAEKISVDDPNCNFPPPTVSEWIFKSTDGGQSFDSGQQLATQLLSAVSTPYRLH